LEKNLIQHRTNERIMRYKLEVYQKKFWDFVYDSPTSTKASDKDEEVEAGPNGTTQEEEVQIKEPHTLRE
jgi:hypothetical protein